MYVLYIQRTRKSGLLLCAVSRNTPLRLEQAFWAQGVPAILTSGTLAAGDAVLLSRSAVGSRLSIRVSVGMLCVRSRLSLFLRQEKRDGLREVAFLFRRGS